MCIIKLNLPLWSPLLSSQCIKRSPFYCPVVENFNWIQSLLRGHLSYRITGNFCDVKFLRFWSKEKTFNFCGFFFLRIVNFGNEKKKCLYYRKQQVKRCYDKQLVHITVILRSKHIFSSREIFKRYNFWIRIWLTFLCPKFWPFNTGLTVHIRSMSSSTFTESNNWKIYDKKNNNSLKKGGSCLRVPVGICWGVFLWVNLLTILLDMKNICNKHTSFSSCTFLDCKTHFRYDVLQSISTCSHLFGRGRF